MSRRRATHSLTRRESCRSQDGALEAVQLGVPPAAKDGIGDHGPARLRDATWLEEVAQAVECRSSVFIEYGCDRHVHREAIRILDEIQQRLARLRGSDRAKCVPGRVAHGLNRAFGPEFGQQRHGGGLFRLAELIDSPCQIPDILHPAEGDMAGIA